MSVRRKLAILILLKLTFFYKIGQYRNIPGIVGNKYILVIIKYREYEYK